MDYYVCERCKKTISELDCNYQFGAETGLCMCSECISKIVVVARCTWKELKDETCMDCAMTSRQQPCEACDKSRTKRGWWNRDHL